MKSVRAGAYLRKAEGLKIEDRGSLNRLVESDGTKRVGDKISSKGFIVVLRVTHYTKASLMILPVRGE
jgi:hypothetical protein